MSDFDEPGLTLDTPSKRRSIGSRFADLGDRLASRFASFDQMSADLSTGESDADLNPPIVDEDMQAPLIGVDETEQAWEQVAARFPVVRRGYDRAAVDQYITELEHELAELRTGTRSGGAVAAEIRRVGEQTSTILIAAHHQAKQITRRAQAEADRCIADAAANAVATTKEADQRLRQLDSETDSVWRERAALIEDMRHVASALVSLAEHSASRFPAESDEPGRYPQANAPYPAEPPSE